MAEIDAAGLSSREVNAAMRKLITEGCKDITLLNPGARHNLAVAVLSRVSIRIAGSAFESTGMQVVELRRLCAMAGL